MAENLTSINSHLIGVSFIQSEEVKQIWKQWDYCFRAENADWIQITDENMSVDDTLGLIVKNRKAQGRSLAGQQIILTGFLDMFRENLAEQTEFIKNLTSELQLNHAIMGPVILFAYVGKNPSPDAEMLRERVMIAAEKTNGRVCLVGRSAAVDDELCWKPEILLLDVLRRSENPLSHLPLPNSTGSIGYLRYAEHSQSRIDAADTEINRLKICLEDEGQDSFRAGLLALVEEIAQKAPEDFPVDGAKQPLHPDMTVNPKKFSFTGVYRKQFENAQKETVNAVHATGSRLVERIKERYIPSDEAADEMIRNIIAQRQPGYGMLEKLQPSHLNLSVEGTLNSSVISLPYNPEGYAGMITQYLIGRRDDGVLQSQQALLEKLKEAFLRVRSEYTGKIETMAKEKKELENFRKTMTSKSEFLLDVSTTGYLLNGSFKPVQNYVGDTRRCLVWRDTADQTQVMKAAGPEACFIDPVNGQMKHVDEFQLKMLEIYFAECERVVPDDLIRQRK